MNTQHSNATESVVPLRTRTVPKSSPRAHTADTESSTSGEQLWLSWSSLELAGTAGCCTHQSPQEPHPFSNSQSQSRVMGCYIPQDA